MQLIPLIKKIWKWKWMLRSLPSTLYFNFHYLPLSQAIRLPIVLCRPHLLSMKGRVEIEGPVRRAQIVLGKHVVSLYPNTGITWDNQGGTVRFSGTCIVGNASCISVGPKGTLSFGHQTCASAALKLVCYQQVTLRDRVRLGWDVTFIDSDLHKLTLDSGGYSHPCRSIEIGENCWLGFGCTILKGVTLPPYTTVSAATVLRRPVQQPPHSVVGTDAEVRLLRQGAWRNLQDDTL